MDDLSFLDKYAQPKPVTTDYDGFIEESASKYGVDPDLIRLQMGTESAFKPKARSPKGASGLMQLMPGTARNLGVKDIYDPKQNIEGGVKYMRQLLDMFGGDVNLALAGYNAGEGAVQKYGNKIPPYKETRNYVKKIAGNYKGTGYHPTSLNFLDKYVDAPSDDAVVDVPDVDSGLSFLDKYVGEPQDPGTIYGMTDADIGTTTPSTDPVPETPDALQRHVVSTLDANSPKKIAWLTKGNPANNYILSMAEARRLTRVDMPDGIALVNIDKLGITKDQAKAYVAQNGHAEDAGFVVDVGNNTGDGQPAVAAIDPNTGKEVFAAVTPDPVSAQVQAQKNAAMFPGTLQVPTNTDEVVANRMAETPLDPNAIATAEPNQGGAYQGQPLNDMSQVGMVNPSVRPPVRKPTIKPGRATLPQKGQIEQAPAKGQFGADTGVISDENYDEQGNVVTEPQAEPKTSFKRRLLFRDKPEDVSNKEWFIQNLIPEIVTETKADAQDVEKALRANLTHEKGTPLVDITKDQFYDFVMTPDFYEKIVATKDNRLRMDEARKRADADFEERRKTVTADNEADRNIAEFEQRMAADIAAGLIDQENADKAIAKIKKDVEDWRKDKGFLGIGNEEDWAEWMSMIAPGGESDEIARVSETGAIPARRVPRKTSKEFFDQAYKDTVAQYGNIQNAMNARREFKKRFENSPMTYLFKTGESAVGGAMKVPFQGAASALKAIAIGSEAIDRATGTGATDPSAEKKYSWQLAKDMESLADGVKVDPDFKGGNAEMFGNVAGQVVVQAMLGTATGGALTPALFGAAMGAAEQYENAGKFRDKDGNPISPWKRLGASLVGGLIEAPDYFIFKGMLKGGNVLSQSRILQNLKATIERGLIAKGVILPVAERAAADATSGFLAELIAKGGWKGTAAKVGQAAAGKGKLGLAEGIQEGTTQPLNDLAAYVIFDPSPERWAKVITPTKQNFVEGVAGFFGGLVGASIADVAARVEGMSPEAIEQSKEMLETVKDQLPPETVAIAEKALSKTKLQPIIDDPPAGGDKEQNGRKPKAKKVTLEPVEDIAKSDKVEAVVEATETKADTSQSEVTAQPTTPSAVRERAKAKAAEKFAVKGEVVDEAKISDEERNARIEARFQNDRRDWIDKERETNPTFAPDSSSAKELLSPAEQKETVEYEALRHKSVAKNPDDGYRDYKMTRQEKSRLVELEKKYRHIYFTPETVKRLELTDQFEQLVDNSGDKPVFKPNVTEQQKKDFAEKILAQNEANGRNFVKQPVLDLIKPLAQPKAEAVKEPQSDKISVGDTVFFPDAVKNDGSQKSGNFRGWDGNDGIIVIDGTQWRIPKSDITTEKLTVKPHTNVENVSVQKEPWAISLDEFNDNYREANPRPDFVEAGDYYLQDAQNRHKGSDKSVVFRNLAALENPDSKVSEYGKTYADTVKKAQQWHKNNPTPDHKALVAQAIKDGKPVPAEVLADYPDLQARAERDAKLTARRNEKATNLEAAKAKVEGRKADAVARRKSVEARKNERANTILGRRKRRDDAESPLPIDKASSDNELDAATSQSTSAAQGNGESGTTGEQGSGARVRKESVGEIDDTRRNRSTATDKRADADRVRGGNRGGQESADNTTDARRDAGTGEDARPGLQAAETQREVAIKDVGEKIGGARKDTWKSRGLLSSDLEGMTAGEESKYSTKPNIWKPDFASLIDAGMEPQAAALVKVIYDDLAPKPESDDAGSRRAYVDAMNRVKEQLEKVKTVDDIIAIREQAADAEADRRGRRVVSKTYSDPLQIDRYKRAKADRLLESGFPNIEPWQRRFTVQKSYDGKYYASSKGLRGRIIARGLETKEEAIAAAKAAYDGLKADKADGKAPERPHLDKIERTGADIRNGRNVTGDDFLKDFGFRGVEFGNWAANDERQTLVNLGYEGLHDLAEVLGIPPKALSLNGTLGLAFGARGSGKALAHYEPTKLVINMTKIRGAGALAHEWGHGLDHYFGELNRDNAYGGKAQYASGGRDVPSRIKDSKNPNIRPEMKEAFDNLISTLFQRDKTKAEAVRDAELDLEKLQGNITQQKAIVEKYKDNKTLTKDSRKWLAYAEPRVLLLQKRLADLRSEKPVGGYGKVESSYYEDAKNLSGKSKEKGYWSRPTELFARAFESYVFDKIQGEGNKSDYLVHGVEADRFSKERGYPFNPYPAGDERAAVNNAFDNLFQTMEAVEGENGNVALRKVAEPTDIADIEALGKGDFKELFNDIKSDVKSDANGANILDLGTNKTIELVRTAFAYMYDTPLEGTAIPGGMYLDPSQTNDFRDALQGIADAASEAGIESKGVDTLIKNLDKAAKDGDVRVIGFENTLKHETGHQQSNRGAVEKPIAKRRTGLRELADGKDTMSQSFRTAFAKWNDLENRNWSVEKATSSQLGQAAEEIAMYIADGQHSRLGLSYAKAIKLGVELQLRYAEARIQENPELTVREALATFEGTILQPFSEQVYEREQSNQSDKGNVESKGAGQGNEYQGRDPGTKESDGDGVSSVGAEFTPGGEEKLSKTPSTLRKGGIPVQERLYTSTTDAERQSFANERMDGGLDAAMKWTRDQLDTKNNNAGATGVVGVNVMMQLGKEGRIAELNKFADDLLPAYTDSAQMIQSLAVVSMFSPDTAGAYVTKVAKQNGQDVTPEQVEKALDIAGRMSEVVQADGISEAALNEATAENERLKKDIADLEEALGLANDKNKEFKGKLSGQGRTIAALRRQIEGEDKGKTRLPGAVRKHVKEITERKDDILERLKQKYGGNPILQMVAPNSQANFDEWFGDSKVVDENGKPLVVYHGTNQDVDAFSPEKRSTKTGNVNAQLGHFFTDNKAEASRYASDWGKDNGNVVPVFLSIQNPYTMPYKEINDLAMGEFHRWTEGATKEDLIRNREDALNAVRERRAELIAEGYDGVFAKIGGKNEYIAFYPNQIKSAIGNNGEYSRDNDSILRSTPNELDQDAVDAATYHLSKNLGKQTPTQVKDAINVLTNGQLTPEQINDVYAAAVSALRIERTAMDADTKAANKLRQSHYREADKINDAKLTDWEKKLNKADSKFVNTTVREGVENGYTDEAIWFALARKHYPSVNDALKALREEFPDADTRTIIRDSERLTQAVKRRLIGDIAQRQNEFSLNETDIDLIKEERRVNTFEKQKVVREANRFYSGMVKDAGEIILDTIVNFRRANLLTAVKTHFVNIGGNVGFAVGEEVARVPSTWVDLVASIFTGERTTALSPYAIGNGLKALVSQDETLKNSKWDTPEGKERGVTAAKHVLQYGGSIADMERLQHSESILSAKFENRPAKWMDNYINGVFKLLGAEDAFFKVYAFRRHIEEQARAIALTERRKDKNVDVKERTKELVQNPTNVMQVQADRYAHFMTFQNDNALSEFIASIKRGRPKTKAAVETIMPYDRTPTNIVIRALEYSPAGLAIAPIRWKVAQRRLDKNHPSGMRFRNELTGAVKADLGQDANFNELPETERRKIIEATLRKTFSREQQEQFAKTIGRASLGTGLFSLGFVLAAAGLMAGAMSFDDDDKEESSEHERRKKAGIENSSILTPWGRIVLPRSPATSAMTAGATFYEQMAMSKKSPLMSAVGAGQEAFTDILAEQPLISSTYNLARTIGKGKVGEFGGNLLGGFVPASAMVRSISEIGDAKERTGSGYFKGEKILTGEDWLRKQARGFRNSFLKGIPGARNYFVDESTTAVSDEERGGIARRIIRQLDPFNTRSATPYSANRTPDNIKPQIDAQREKLKSAATSEEKKEIQSEINRLSKLVKADASGKQSKSDLISKVTAYAEAIGTDPITAFRLMFKGESIRRVDNDAIIVERMSVEDSQKTKKERGATSDLRLDHKTPLALGGDNSEENLQLVTEAEWKSYTPVETYLGRQLKANRITKAEAGKLITDFKEKRISFEQIKERMANKPRKLADMAYGKGGRDFEPEYNDSRDKWKGMRQSENVIDRREDAPLTQFMRDLNGGLDTIQQASFTGGTLAEKREAKKMLAEQIAESRYVLKNKKADPQQARAVLKALLSVQVR